MKIRVSLEMATAFAQEFFSDASRTWNRAGRPARLAATLGLEGEVYVEDGFVSYYNNITGEWHVLELEADFD